MKQTDMHVLKNAVFFIRDPIQSMEQFSGRVRPLNCHLLRSCLLLTLCKQTQMSRYLERRFAHGEG